MLWKKCLAKIHGRRRLVENFLYLSLLQGGNYILPLITVPYLVRVLGIECFGILSFATAIIAYFSLIIDFGFDLVATREISINRFSQEKITEIFNSIITLKFFFIFISFLLLSIIVLSFDRLKGDWIIYYFSFLVAIGQALFPVWFFQGLEKMGYVSCISLLSKTIFTMSIFLFVHESSDYYLVPILNGVGGIVGGCLSLLIIKNKFDIKFSLQKRATLAYYVKEAKYVFFSRVAISLYTTSTIVILGIFSSNTAVGCFAAADKIIQAIKGLMYPINQTVYPYIANKIKESENEGIKLIRKLIFLVLPCTFLLSLCTYFSAEYIVLIILGEKYKCSTIIVKILSPLPLVVSLSNILGVQTMLNLGRKKEFSFIIAMGSIVNITISFYLVPLFQEIGSAFSVLIVEIMITVLMLFYLNKSGIKFLNR